MEKQTEINIYTTIGKMQTEKAKDKPMPNLKSRGLGLEWIN